MKETSDFRVWIGLFILFAAGMSVPVVRAGFEFVRPETPLVEPPYYPAYQSHVYPSFDYLGNIHYVWEDDRNGPTNYYGTTIMNNGFRLNPYPVFGGSDDLLHPFVLSSIVYPNNMFALGTNSVSNEITVLEYDLMQLPGQITPVIIGINPVSSPPVDAFEATSVANRLVFGYESFPNLHFGGFQIGGGWDMESSILAAGMDYLQNVDIAVDSENYLYLCYDRCNDPGPNYDLIVRRSVNPGEFSSGFHLPHIVMTLDSGPFFPQLAVTGSFTDSDLAVSVLYIHPDIGLTAIECVTELNGDWATSDFFPLGNTIVNDDNSSMVSIIDNGFDAQYDANTRRLYVTWADDRMQPMSFLYGDISYDRGLSFGTDRTLGVGVLDVVEAPRLTLGASPGNLAVSYTRMDGPDFYPLSLVSIPEFYDTCDVYPPAHWDGFAGITLDDTVFHGFEGSSYALENGRSRGLLVRDYAGIEQQGVIDLYFYDTMDTTVGIDFMIAVENVNAARLKNDRGVIRMLGVKNDVTPTTHYKFFDGSVWETFSSGAERSAGWHNVIITLAPGGTTFRLETSPGVYEQRVDTGFETFTSLEIQADPATPPYNVDDIKVEVYAVGGPVPLPALSVIGLLIVMIGMAVVLRRQ